MAWVVQEYEQEVHVVPDTDPVAHVLMATCWCVPEVERHAQPLVIHRDELDRRELG